MRPQREAAERRRCGGVLDAAETPAASMRPQREAAERLCMDGEAVLISSEPYASNEAASAEAAERHLIFGTPTADRLPSVPLQ